MSRLLQITEDNYYKEVVASKQLVVAYFSASWCRPCKSFSPLFEEMSKEFKGKASFAKVDAELSVDIVEKHRVMNLPTVLILAQTKEIGRITGAVNKDKLRTELVKYVG